MYITVYPGKLSNSPKWPKPQPSRPSLAKAKRKMLGGFPGGSVVKNPPVNAEAWVQSLIWEDLTCCRAAKPVCHNY